MGKIKYIICKYRVFFGILIGVGFAIVGPIFIDKAYESTNKIFFTSWEASDTLSYYGTLLGAVATIIAVIQTIDHSRKLSIEEREHSESINRRNEGIRISYELIEACKYEKIIQAALNNDQENELSIKFSILFLKNEIEVNYNKLRFLYPTIAEDTEGVISWFVSAYNVILNQLIRNFDKNSLVRELEDLEKFYRKNYEEFEKTLSDYILNK